LTESEERYKQEVEQIKQDYSELMHEKCQLENEVKLKLCDINSMKIQNQTAIDKCHETITSQNNSINKLNDLLNVQNLSLTDKQDELDKLKDNKENFKTKKVIFLIYFSFSKIVRFEQLFNIFQLKLF